MCPFSTLSFYIRDRIIWTILYNVIYIVLRKSGFDQWCSLFSKYIGIYIDLYFPPVPIGISLVPPVLRLFPDLRQGVVSCASASVGRRESAVRSAANCFFMFVFSLFHLVPRDEALVIRIAPAIFTRIHRVSYFAGLSIYRNYSKFIS